MKRSWKLFTIVGLVVLLSSATASGQAQEGSPARTDAHSAWPMFGFDARHTSSSTSEHVLDASNVANLQLMWSRSTGDERCCGSPIVSRHGTVLIPGGDYHLHAFDGESGAVRWTSPQEVYSFSGSILDGVVFVGLTNGAAAFRVSSGQLVWSSGGCDFQGIGAPPTVVDGTVYAGLNDPELVALDAKTGECLWQALPHMGADYYSSPSIVDGIVYVGDGRGQLWSADATDGTVRWRAAAAGAYSETAVSTVVATARRVYASAGNVVGAYKASTGVRVWAVGFGQPAVFGPPAFANGVIYVGLSDGRVFALARDGEPLWWAYIGAARTSVSVANGVVYAASDKLYAIDASDGTILWSGAIGPGGTSDSAPAIANAMVYVEGLNGRLYAFGLPN